MQIIRLRNKNDVEILCKPEAIAEILAKIEKGEETCAMIVESHALSCIFNSSYETT